jgi:hydrogenase maturation factor HypE
MPIIPDTLGRGVGGGRITLHTAIYQGIYTIVVQCNLYDI